MRFIRSAAAYLSAVAFAVFCCTVSAADISFNITKVAESNPFPPATGGTFSYADVWSEAGYVYVGSDRGTPRTGHISNGSQGISIFSISNSGNPTFLPPPSSPPAGYVATTYFGTEMEDVEVYDGIGYFASDNNLSSPRTGVDIVDLSIPFDPILLSRVDGSDCLSGSPTVCAHGKVHTLSVQRFNPNTPSETRFLYTSDNESTVIKITDVTNPSSPQLIRSLSLTGVGSGVDSHEVAVRNNRLYVASKNPSNSSGEGYFHIFDVADPANPVLLKSFLSGASTHTAMPTESGNVLVVAEERNNGNVKIYDISNINAANDPDAPILRKTLNRSTVCVSGGNCLDAHSPHHVHIFGNLLFLPWYEAGLTVFNISDPSNPKWVGAYDSYAGTSTNFNGNWGVDLSRGLKQVLISDRTRGLIVLDASSVVLPGDYNQDMTVNDLDYTVWKSSYGATRSSVHDLALADGNYDGVVDTADYVIWRDHYGQIQTGYPVGAGAAVPEPGAIVLLCAGVFFWASRQSQRTA